MGMVALLILVDLLVLSLWNLTDPIRCSRSVGAAVKVELNGDLVKLYTASCDSALFDHRTVWGARMPTEYAECD